MPDNFIPVYDLESLNENQRQDYIRAVCKHMGVPDNLNLVSLTYVDEGEGPSRLVAYAKRGATENVRNNLQIDVTSLTNQMIGGSIVFTATATSKKTGRQEISTGSKYIDGLQGTALDDAIMTAQTRALRRVTLQFIGAGVLDESEVGQRKTIHVATSVIAPTPQPTVQPSSEPGKDVTEVIKVMSDPDKARDLVINQLNSEVKQEEPKQKKTRKPRKAKVDLGPSEVPPVIPVTAQPTESEKVVAPPVVQAVVPAPPTASTTPPVQKKPKISAGLSKPFRQRYFKIMQESLEPAGFAPVEGMGNTAKMRSLAQIMFTDVSDMNDLTAEQWEKYLSLLENKIKIDGPKETIKYIEETIGL